MCLFLGFDAGGTKTDCVLVDSAGQPVAGATGGAANPLRTGLAKACSVLEETALRTLEESRQGSEKVRAICAGVAGAGRPSIAAHLTSFLSHVFPKASVRVTTDIGIALEAALRQSQSTAGIVIVAGTGSAALGCNLTGNTARAGGWGPWIGDYGSAYDIGRHAVEAALRAGDHLGPPTLLGEKILHSEKASDWDALLERIALHPDDVFPKLFPVVVETAGAMDAVAREILVAAAKSLASLAQALVGSLGLRDHPFILAKSGGVFGRSTFFDATLDQELSCIAPAARIELLRISPAQAAAEAARKSVSDIPAHGT